MGKTAIFYGSTTGNTEQVAETLAKKLNVTDIFDVAKADAKKFNDFDVLIFGSSTLSYGELQDDWEDFIDKVKGANLESKKVAVFGLGDASSYSDTFCDAIGIIAKAAEEAGAKLIGNKVAITDYNYDESASIVDGYFCGLPLDEDNEPELTEERIEKWIAQLKPEL